MYGKCLEKITGYIVMLEVMFKIYWVSNSSQKMNPSPKKFLYRFGFKCFYIYNNKVSYFFIALQVEQIIADSNSKSNDLTDKKEGIILCNESQLEMDIDPEIVVQTLNADSKLDYYTPNKNEEPLKLSGQLFLKLVKLSKMLIVLCLYISN